MSLSKLNKDELIERVIAAEQGARESEKLFNEQNDKHIETIANLQSRCMTLRHQRKRDLDLIDAFQSIVAGLKMVNDVLSESRLFDIRCSGVMGRLLKLFSPGTSIHVCSVCGDITKADSGLSGERICKKCMKEADWPWTGETFYHGDDNGEMVGWRQIKYKHPSGGMASVSEYQQAE